MKAVFAAILFVAGVACAHAADNQQPQAPIAQVQKWEYATMQLGQAPLWQSGKGYIQEVGIHEFRAKLAAEGILGPIDKSAVVFAELWQAIGDKGWELVAVTDNGSVTTYYFKRLKS